MLPSETMIWQPEFTDKTLSRKPGAVQRYIAPYSDQR
ncbi:transposase [Escherichia coli]|nr:transposase [Escherichia coli]KJW43274.1 transposase [Escherichia coli]KJY11521.1 transposase [Escherichia coli]